MGNFFKSLFSSSKAATPEEEKSKNDQKKFDILKYDGVRAQKIGQVAYAIKCFTEALNLQEDFETMTYLVAAYTTANKADEALEVLNRMVELEPDHINTLLTRVSVLFMLDKDADVIADCRHILELASVRSLPDSAWTLTNAAQSPPSSLPISICTVSSVFSAAVTVMPHWNRSSTTLPTPVSTALQSLPDSSAETTALPFSDFAWIAQGFAGT